MNVVAAAEDADLEALAEFAPCTESEGEGEGQTAPPEASPRRVQAEVVKSTHAVLRNAYRAALAAADDAVAAGTGGAGDGVALELKADPGWLVWTKHLEQQDVLSQYAEAMDALACSAWTDATAVATSSAAAAAAAAVAVDVPSNFTAPRAAAVVSDGGDGCAGPANPPAATAATAAANTASGAGLSARVRADRYEWAAGFIADWFAGRPSGMERAISKELRRQAWRAAEADAQSDGGSQPNFGEADSVMADGIAHDHGGKGCPRRIAVLDVGSNNNLLGRDPRFADSIEVTAIDIAPAHPSVSRADLLSVTLWPAGSVSGDDAGPSPPRKTVSLVEGSFSVVLFSLLLSYMPSTRMRYECCKRARRLLRTHGVLLVVAPDSNSQSKGVAWMKAWKQAIEGLGFRRVQYTKTAHLHTMAFQAIELTNGTPAPPAAAHALVYIPQDRRLQGRTSPHTSR